MADLSDLAVVFDLDGTLIDSAPDIVATAGRVLAGFGLPPLSAPTIRGFVGKGLPNLVARLIEASGQPPEGPLLAPMMARFETEYLTSHGLTTIYPGAVQALDALAGAGAALGLCTNKPIAPTLAVLDHLNLRGRFPVILGGDSLPVRKPDPAHFHGVAQALGRPRAVLVGDSEVDADTARAAGVPLLLFTEGYRRSPVEQIAHAAAFDRFDDLPRLVAGLARLSTQS